VPDLPRRELGRLVGRGRVNVRRSQPEDRRVDGLAGSVHSLLVSCLTCGYVALFAYDVLESGEPLAMSSRHADRGLARARSQTVRAQARVLPITPRHVPVRQASMPSSTVPAG
jgi:hypothetical protein